jgi:hypothetical protein
MNLSRRSEGKDEKEEKKKMTKRNVIAKYILNLGSIG